MALDEMELITTRDTQRCTLSSENQINTWHKTMNASTDDDLGTEEIQDIKENLSGTEQPARFNNVDDLLNDLDN